MPVIEKGTDTEAPVQNGDPVIELMVIEFEQALLIVVPLTVKLPPDTVGATAQF